MLDQVHRAAARISGVLAFVAFPLFLTACEPSPSDRFPGPWVVSAKPGDRPRAR